MGVLYTVASKLDEERNRTWELNDQKIKDAYFSFVDKYHKVPTYAELKEMTDLSVPTIVKHLDNSKLDDRTRKIKVYTDNVLAKLTELATKGDIKAIKLYLQVVERWNEKLEVKQEITTDAIQLIFGVEDKSKVETTETVDTSIEDIGTDD